MSGEEGRERERGMTLMELTFLILLLSFAAFIFSRFVLSTRDAVSRQEAAQYMTQDEVRSSANLDAGLNTCIELLANYSDGTGNAMLTLRDLVNSSVGGASVNGVPAPPAAVSFSLWPTVETESQVDMNGPTDAGAVNWGNELAYVAALNPITFTAYYTQSGSTWSVGSASSSTSVMAEVLSVDRCQFVYDYLSYYTGSIINSCGNGIRLTEWRSQPMANYDSLSSLTDSPGTYGGNTCCPRLTAACTYLSNNGYTYAFNPQGATLTTTCSQCFYSLTAADVGGGIAATKPSTLPTGTWGYLDDYDLMMTNQAEGGQNAGRIARSDGGAGGQTSGQGGYSVGFNVTGKATSDTVKALQGPGGVGLIVPAYAELNNKSGTMGGPGFPAGFEVGIDGQEGSREVFVRLVLMASNAGSTGGQGIFQAVSATTEVSFSPTCDF